MATFANLLLLLLVCLGEFTFFFFFFFFFSLSIYKSETEGGPERSCRINTQGSSFEDVPVVEFMYVYLYACQARVTVGDAGLCCSACVTSFER